ncbi:DNA polymerase I [Nordella sp. HKS 07]|nr:DNA polymerase I [Nordella sp. HKS 07]
MVAKELRSGEIWTLWRGEFGTDPPFPVGTDTLLIAYYASAELGCFKALGWSQPVFILDLFTEFRARTNGLTLPHGAGLLGAAAWFGIDGIDITEKQELRACILAGGPWAAEDRAAILQYCGSDVRTLERLLAAMLPRLDLPRALLRGRFMKAAAAIEWNGTPVDTVALELLRRYWTAIQYELIADIDRDYGVFDGRSFRLDRWQRYLAKHAIPWPVLESGRLDLSDDTFRQMARAWPAVSPMRELRSALSDLRLADLAVGSDGRNRTILSAFRSRTGRCQPSNTRYIFGPSVWLRSLVQPPEGFGVAYIDWCQQEHGIAAALSGDPAMQTAYRSRDPYFEFARQAGAVPAGATKHTHGPTRELFKQCALAVAYGMEGEGLARRIGKPPIVGRDLLRIHHETYRTFWRWSDATVDQAMLTGSLQTVFGWPVLIGEHPNPRSLRNFPCQANGSEMLRLAACLATEAGIEVCALIHDAVLICAPLDRLDHDIARMRDAMAKASRIVLDGFELRTDVHLTRHPDRYSDPRGALMWNRVMKLIEACQARQQVVA